MIVLKVQLLSVAFSLFNGRYVDRIWWSRLLYEYVCPPPWRGLRVEGHNELLILIIIFLSTSSMERIEESLVDQRVMGEYEPLLVDQMNRKVSLVS